MITEEAYEAMQLKERAKWAMRRAHLYHYADYTEMIDEPRTTQNDEKTETQP